MSIHEIGSVELFTKIGKHSITPLTCYWGIIDIDAIGASHILVAVKLPKPTFDIFQEVIILCSICRALLKVGACFALNRLQLYKSICIKKA